ncbi:MAG: ABC transporter substrate-binding protein [Thermoguttaceae bacterium]|nr:ABC transporter substrate-binding protein [Thermoguttaceae bacterium]
MRGSVFGFDRLVWFRQRWRLCQPPEKRGTGWNLIGYLCLLILVSVLPTLEPAEPPPKGEKSPSGQDQAPPAKPSGSVMAGRLIDQEPYDRIFLDAANNNVVLEVFPLDLPDRKVPEKPTQPLVIRLLNRPETKYEVAWNAIVKIELFEQRVLQEAQQLVQQGQFEEAYEYFHYLYQHYPKMAGLDAAYQEALWQEAASWYRQQHYDRALAVLRTLWEKNKDWPNLSRAMGMAVERLVEQYVSAQEYEAARQMLRQLGEWYPQHEVAGKWEEQFRSQAAALHAQAKAALEKNALREASEAARKMIQLWPSLPGAQQLWDVVRHKYPRIVVGVCLPVRIGTQTDQATVGSPGYKSAAATSNLLPHQTTALQSPSEPEKNVSKQFPDLPTSRQTPGAEGPPAQSGSSVQAKRGIFTDGHWWTDRADWAARRTARLLGRHWMELVSLGSEGGQYRCPVGNFQIEELGRRLVFRLRPNVRDVHGREINGYRLAELLLKLTEPRCREYRPEWADRVESITVKDIYTVEVVLRRAHVRPESLLSFPIADLPSPYQLLQANDRETVFILNPQYVLSSSSQPKEIVEILFSNPREALAALRAGKVDLVDRIPPAVVEQLQESKDIQVGQYALPVLHVLVLNPNRPLLAQARFRRALEYGIAREEILAQIYGRSKPSAEQPAAVGGEAQPSSPPAGQDAESKPPLRPANVPTKSLVRLPPGFRVLSAPIPMGASFEDPISYGYDRSQKARSYNPRLALALARLSWAEVSGRGETVLESAPSGPSPAAGPPPSSTPVKPGPETKPSAPSGTTVLPKQPPKESPHSELPPAKPPSKPEPSPKQPPESLPTPPEKKPRPDPFAEEPGQQTSKDKPPSAQPAEKPESEAPPPSGKPSPKESAQPPAEPQPRPKQPADPFSEHRSDIPNGSWTTEQLRTASSARNNRAAKLCQLTATFHPLPTLRDQQISRSGSVERSPIWEDFAHIGWFWFGFGGFRPLTGKDFNRVFRSPSPLLELLRQPLAAGSGTGVESHGLVRFSDRLPDRQLGEIPLAELLGETAYTSSTAQPNPFDETDLKPQPSESALEQAKASADKQVPEQPEAKPSENQPISTQPLSKAPPQTPTEKQTPAHLPAEKPTETADAG